MDELCVLNIKWDRPGLPTLVGPFDSTVEAREWGELNVPSGSWEVHPLARPYERPEVTEAFRMADGR